jgi:N-glycosylase/DNA lyase
MSSSTDWVDLQVEPDELRADLTLAMGQCFNWRRLQQQSSHMTQSPGGAGASVASDSLWIGVVDDLAIAVKQTPTTTMYKIINKLSMNQQDKNQVHARLHEYFQLKESLKELYDRWATGCNRMKAVTESLQGVRVVRQDPFECLISFICSSNNNIKVHLSAMLPFSSSFILSHLIPLYNVSV